MKTLADAILEQFLLPLMNQWFLQSFLHFYPQNIFDEVPNCFINGKLIDEVYYLIVLHYFIQLHYLIA